MNKALNKALALYGLIDKKCQLIKSQSNYIFGIADQILQLTPTAYKSRDELWIEVNWIDYLNKNGLEVVQLVKSNNDNLLEALEEFTVICYKKIEGKKASRANWNTVHFKKLGTLTGTLHRLGQAFEKEHPFKYKHWDEISKGKFVDYLPQDQRGLVDLYEELTIEFATYPINNNTYGLIHYDIHHENYFLQGEAEKIILFDFEMTCTSWYMNDISVILYYILNAVPFDERETVTHLFMDTFFQTYRQEFPLQEEDIIKIPKFLLYRDLLVYGYTFRIWPEKDNLRDNAQQFRKKLSDSIARRRKALIW